MRACRHATLLSLLLTMLPPAARGAEPWRGNKIGISEVPPPPFTAVTVTMDGGAARIGCWGRTYSLAGVGLPAQIRSMDADMLAAPVSLVAASGGSVVEWQTTGMRLVKSNQAQVIVAGEAESRVGKLAWKCTAEYDGLLRYDLELTPAGEASLDTLELRFPLKAEHARLNWRHEHYWPINHFQGALPPGDGVLISGSWRAYIWLGDEDRGIALFTETPEPWQKIDSGEAFRVERKEGRLDVVWPFANGDRPWQLAKPWKLTFGIEATPVRDTTGWRRWRHSRRQTRDVVWGNLQNEPPGGPGIYRTNIQDSNPAYTKHYAYPESADPKYYRALVDKAHAMGYKFLPYFMPRHLGEFAPEAKYLPQWRSHEEGGVYGFREFVDISGGKAITVTIHKRRADGSDETFTTGPVLLRLAFTDPYIAVAPTPEWIDFMVWKCDKWVRDLDADGLYADYVHIDEGTNAAAGLGYERDGVRYSTWPFFANRILHKRLYTMLKQMDKDTFYMAHISRDLYISHLAFCDGYLTGEGHASTGYIGKDYDEVMPLDAVQAYYMGHNYGVPAYLVTQVGTRKDPVASEKYMISMSLLHDFGLRHAGERINAVYGVMDAFGIVEARFFPYWRNSDLVRGQTEKTKVSVYCRAEAGSLVVVGNVTREQQQPTLVMSWDKMQAQRPLKVVDALTGKAVSVNAQSLTVDVEPLGFRLLWIK